jgi:hypothetical protein
VLAVSCLVLLEELVLLFCMFVFSVSINLKGYDHGSICARSSEVLLNTSGSICARSSEVLLFVLAVSCLVLLEELVLLFVFSVSVNLKGYDHGSICARSSEVLLFVFSVSISLKGYDRCQVLMYLSLVMLVLLPCLARICAAKSVALQRGSCTAQRASARWLLLSKTFTSVS